MIKLRLRGATHRQISKLLKVHENTIYAWNRKPEFKILYLKTRAQVFGQTQDLADQRARQVEKDIEEVMEEYSHKAIHTIDKLTRASDDRVKLRAAMDLADRGKKTAKTKKVQQTNLNVFVTPEALKAASQTARELMEFGMPIKPIELDASMVDEIDDSIEPDTDFDE